jgi:hypothetical protein
MDGFYEDLDMADRKLSQQGLELLKGKTVQKYRWDSKRKELCLEFEDGTRLFIDNILDEYDISIT